MIWKEIKADLELIISEAACLDDLIRRDDFWDSGEERILSAVAFLQEKGKPALGLDIIDAAHQRSLALSPDIRIRFLYLRADLLHDLGRYQDAVAVYSAILEMENPASGIAHVNRGLAFWELRDIQAALKDYLDAIKIDPQNAVALRGAGEMSNRLDRPAEAIVHLRAAVKLDPLYAPAFAALGVAYYNDGDFAKSYRALNRAVELDPDDIIAKKGIAKIEQHFDLE
ncbi:hypothetical protein BH09SUM1_BH09SUM1_13670 [soil metagenome]